MKTSLKRLAIDTSTDYLYLSLLLDCQEVGCVYTRGNNNHSVTIIPLMEDLLKQQNWTLKDINQVIIGIGPGSYTGVRIGVSIAKMIGYLNQVEVKTVSSLLLLATSSESEYVLPLIDARRNQGFMALYRQQNHQFTSVKEEALCDIDAYQSTFQIPYEIVKDGCPKITKLLDSDSLCPVDNIHELVPNYLQITEAERNRNVK